MRKEAIRLQRVLVDAGFTAYFAGGCVRDQLLGLEPKDYDIATNALPHQVVRLFPDAHQVGAHFGVILVRSAGFHYEIATFRTDGSYADGRRPQTVTFSTPEEDAQRRDFTINGLFYDPIADRIIDFVGGQRDLERGVIRAIGDPDQRFREDYLRLLRAVRFAETMDYEIDPATWAAIRRDAPGLTKISPERIRDEFVRMMRHPHRVIGFDLLVDSGLMETFLPEILTLRGCEQPPEWHPEGDVFIHTRLMLSLLAPDASINLILAVLLHDIAKPDTYFVDETGRIRFNGHDKLGAAKADGILRRLRFPNETIEAVVEMVANHMRYMHVQDMRSSTLKRFMARPTFPEELELHRVDCAGSNGFTDNYEFLQAKQSEFSVEPLIPPRLIGGHHLLRLGYPPGPKIGEILTAVQNLQLEGRLATEEEALDWVREHFPANASPAAKQQE
jgi:poly(A) polymerase